MPLSVAVLVGTLTDIRQGRTRRYADARIDTPTGSVPIAFWGEEVVATAMECEGLPVLIFGTVRPKFSERTRKWFLNIDVRSTADIRVLSEQRFSEKQPARKARETKIDKVEGVEDDDVPF